MCPSYIVTREETHTTRGRARLLFEMLQGEVITDGWRSEEVHDALDLCLACKGCTSDCPVHVDIPTLKAEFLHHHYARRLRPRHAYAFGLIDQVARVASKLPGVVNVATGNEPFASVLKRAIGMSAHRAFPAFAPLTLRDWFLARGDRNPQGRPVILWPDTFNNYLQPQVGVAAVEVLEAAGYRIVMPRRHFCCGRPLYDYGMLKLARSYFRRILEDLREEIRAGVPLVGMEPSCVAAFRHELRELLPHDDDAARLAGQVRHFGEFVVQERIGLPRLEGKALYWRHCHHHATGGIEADHELLGSMGLELTAPTGGCCGQAGAWGFEREHHGLSRAIGEHALLPAVRAAAAETLIVANGFSCQTQVESGTNRRALHVAEVMKLAREHSGSTLIAHPELQACGPPDRSPHRALRRRSALVASGATLAAVGYLAGSHAARA